ncbi:MAG: hypothetical protein ACREJ9_04830 [Candidatus Rokuibacteriota bacterium]
MKVYLDACVIDWLLDDARSADFLALIRERRLKAFVGGDVVAEIAATPLTKGDRRLRLLSVVFGGVLRLAPTRIPIVGGRPPLGRAPLRRRSVVRSTPAPPEAAALLRKLRAIGIRKLDSVHLIEAALASVASFVTTDKKDLLKKRPKIKAETCVDVMRPEDVLRRLGR